VPRLQPNVPRLQPYLPRLQPYVPRLQPYVPQVADIEIAVGAMSSSGQPQQQAPPASRFDLIRD
tara:strand:+ start:415 stop:606 length:192 start_codon:yes stop_codon:yes gene_type:complete